MIDLIRVAADAPPKWYRALTISGKPAGLGFQCPKCHLGYPHSAPTEIFHCGALEKAPMFPALLPQRSIGGAAQLPPNFLKFGAW
jgi:hypothetical protein